METFVIEEIYCKNMVNDNSIQLDNHQIGENTC